MKQPMEGAAVKVVDALVLVMECLVQNSTSQALGLEHARDKWLKFDVAMVELPRDRSSQLHLNGLEAKRRKIISITVETSAITQHRGINLLISAHGLAIGILTLDLFGSGQSSDQGGEVLKPMIGPNGVHLPPLIPRCPA